MRTIEFTIPGVPEQKRSPKLGTINGRAMAFSDKRNITYEAIIRSALHDSGYVHTEPHAGPVALACVFYFPFKASWNKSKTAGMEGAFKIGTPDIDRLLNNIQDALSHGVVYKDDSQIVAVVGKKQYSKNPHTRVTIWLYEPVWKDEICKATSTRGGKRKKA
jgi:Holliday junction resolvase RusA-like endonuclease